MTTAPPPGGGEPHPSGAIDLALWERTIAGMATPAEQARVSAWVTAVAGHPPVANLLRTAVHQLEIQAGAPDLDVSSSLQRVHARIEAVTIQPRPPRPATDHRPWPRGVGGSVTGFRATVGTVGARAARPQSLVAAIVVVVLGVGLAIGSLRHHASVASPGRTYATAARQRLSVMLVDGTRLTLAPASKVRVAADYGQGTAGRELELEGEAYFAVAHDAAHPFVVRAHGAVARDVGTAFDVRAFPEDAGARIAVAEGAVAVTVAGGCPAGLRSRPAPRDGNATSAWASSRGSDGEPCGAEARAGDVATVAGASVAVKHGMNVGGLTGWTGGKLVFVDEPVADVVRDLSRWYGVRIEVGDAVVGRRPFSSTLDGESVTEALDALCVSVLARRQQRGDGFVLYAAGGR